MSTSSNNMNAAMRSMGRAESTLAHDKAAMRLFRGYRQVKQLPPTLNPDEVKGDMLQEYLINFGNYFCTRPVARNFNESLEPTNAENLHCLTPAFHPHWLHRKDTPLYKDRSCSGPS